MKSTSPYLPGCHGAWRWAAVLFLLWLTVLPRPASAELSPELMSMLNEMQGKLLVDFAADPKSRDDCQKEVINIARAAFNYRNISSVGEKSGAILIGALEHGCKYYLGLAGLEAVATTYSVAKCFYEYADDVNNDAGFFACLAGEAIGFGAGKLGEKIGVEAARQAIADRVVDAGVDKLKDEINSRRSAISNNEVDLSETTLGDGCKVQLNIQWTKARNPVREQRSNGRAGTVTVALSIRDCKCSRNVPLGQQLRNGSLIINLPVNFVANGSAQPAWQADYARMRVNLQATCCGGRFTYWGDPPRADPRPQTDGPAPGSGTIGTTGSTGRTPTPGGGGGGTSARPVPPVPPVAPVPPPRSPVPAPAQPAPPEPPKPFAAVCPECAPLVDQYNRAVERQNAVRAQIRALYAEIDGYQSAARDARANIRTLERLLAARRGEGGSGYDPATGITVTATNNGDGTVTVTTTGPDGSVLERHTRDSRSARDAQKELAAERQREADARAAEAAAMVRMVKLEGQLRDAVSATGAAYRALERCIEECKRRTGTAVEWPVVNRVDTQPLDPRWYVPETPRPMPGGARPPSPVPTPPVAPVPPADPPARTGCLPCQPGAGAVDVARAEVRETEARLEQSRAEMHALSNQFFGDGARKATPEDNAAFGRIKDRARAQLAELELRKQAVTSAESKLVDCNAKCAVAVAPAAPVAVSGGTGQPAKPARQWPPIPGDPQAGYLPPCPDAACTACNQAYSTARNLVTDFVEEAVRSASAMEQLQTLRDAIDGKPYDSANKYWNDAIARSTDAERERAAVGGLDSIVQTVDYLGRIRSQYISAVAALEACNQKCKTTVSVETVVGVTGSNPFNPTDPIGVLGGGGVIQPPDLGSLPGRLQFSSASYSGGEGGAVLVTVTRAGGSKGAVGVTYATSSGSATAGSDFTPANGTLSWADGDTTPKSFSIALIDDTAVESTESLTVALNLATGGAQISGPSVAIISIIDNDSPPPPQPAGNIQFSTATYSVNEGGGAAQITVTRTGGSAGQVTVQYNTGPSSATAGSDYTPVTGTLVWEAGDTNPKSFSVPIIDDTQVEGAETFFVNLNSPSGGATLGAPATATVTIVDNDVATGPCGAGGNAWAGNVGSYTCSGSCSPTPSPQALSVNGDFVTLSPHHAGGAATFQGCGNMLTSQSNTLTYFSQSNHTSTITRAANNSFSANIVSSGGGSCFFSCSR